MILGCNNDDDAQSLVYTTEFVYGLHVVLIDANANPMTSGVQITASDGN